MAAPARAPAPALLASRHHLSGSSCKISFEFSHRAVDQPIVDSFALSHKTTQKRLVTQCIYQPGNAMSILKDFPQRRFGKVRAPIATRNMDPVMDVLIDFLSRQWRQMIPNRNSLAKLL